MKAYKKSGVYIALVGILFQILSPYVDADTEIVPGDNIKMSIQMDEVIESLEFVEAIDETLEYIVIKNTQIIPDEIIDTIVVFQGDIEQEIFIQEVIISDEATIIAYTGIISGEVEIVDSIEPEEITYDEIVFENTREAQFSLMEELSHFEEFSSDDEPESFYESNNIPKKNNEIQLQESISKPEDIVADTQL